tara:strand:- start:4902 stop:5258 length:357 start_codon:yes stop_codon:yes gene_type:complete
MTVIGKFRHTRAQDPLSELIGQIHTLTFDGKLAIIRESASDKPNAPSHRIYLLDESRGRFEVGAAWTQKIKRGAREGEEFLSANIDDESFAKPLSFAVFQHDEDSWSATWRRRLSNAQ